MRAGFSDDDESLELVDAALTSANERARVLALRAAARRHRLDASAWLRALRDGSPEVRREALTLLAHDELGHEEVIGAVTSALGDPDDLVVDAAAFAIGEHHLLGALDALVDVAGGHRDARCREAAVAALGALGDDRGRGAILAALDDKAPVRRRAVVALANFEGPEVDAALERAREDRDWQVRAAADQLGDDED